MSKLNAESLGIGIEDLENVPQPPRFKIRRFSETLTRPNKEWGIPNVGGPGDLIMVVGEPGAAKTSIAIDLMVRLALGQPAFGQFPIGGPMSSLLCYAEGGGGIPSRFRAAMSQLGCEPNDPRLSAIAETDYVPKLLVGEKEPDNAEQFIKVVLDTFGRDNLPAVIIFDTMIDAGAGGDENASNLAQLLCANAKKITIALNCLVVFVQHPGKNKDEFGRGSSVYRGKMDCIIYVAKDPRTKLPTGSIRCVKLKDGEQWGPLGFKANVHGDSIGLEWVGMVPNLRANQLGHRDYLLNVMRSNATGISAAKSAKQLADLTGISVSTLNGLFPKLSQGENSKVCAVMKKVLDSGGKKNRPAKHFYLPEAPGRHHSAFEIDPDTHSGQEG